MKTSNMILSLLLITALFSSCKKNWHKVVVGKGETVTESRQPGNFNRIHLSIDANVHFVQDSVYKLEVSAQQNLMSVIETKTDGKELDIEYSANVAKHSPINITIHAPDISKFSVSGSGNIDCANKITTNSLELKVSGSGDIDLAELVTDNLSSHISGSGNVDIHAGTTNYESFEISGSGNCNALDFKATTANVKVSGSGDIKLYCTESLEAKISGSGNVSYKGNPGVNSSCSGSGKLVHLN
ncbi:MAG: hypothetical protein K0S32_1921 [Bacteroidetes bacterium]|jgi:hypothetical protein|nr:hypothetical protein [Bacteroidota bacterium]